MRERLADESVFADLSKWSPADPQKGPALLHGASTFWDGSGLPNPCDLYLLLSDLFGEHTTLNSEFIPGDKNALPLDRLFFWLFSLESGHWRMGISGGRTGVEVFIVGPARASETARGLLQGAIRDALKVASDGSLSQRRLRLSRLDVLVNPYFREHEITKQGHEILQNVEIRRPPERPPHRSPLRKYKQYVSALRQYQNSATVVRYHSMSLLAHAPICGESFINLALFVLGRQKLLEDRRFYEGILRTDIDLRIKGLALYCQGFDSAISMSDEPFKKFHKVMKRRNQRFHGAMDPLAQKLAEVYMDGDVSLFRSRNSPAITMHGVDDLQALRDEALGDAATVDEFISYILAGIKEPNRLTLEAIMDAEILGWSETSKTLQPLGRNDVRISLGHPIEDAR